MDAGHFNSPRATFNAAGSATDDVTTLRRAMERYRRLLRMVTDQRAIASLKQLLAETEDRFLTLARRSNGAPVEADD